MTEVTSTNSFLNDLSISQVQQSEPKENELGQSAFLELMITQLENQDPLSPQDNTEFVAQLAQFSSVESLDRLNQNFDSFTSSFVANQALQASSLVGRSVTVPANTSRLDGGGVVSANVDLPSSSSDVTVSIYNEAGSLIDQIPLGSQAAGPINLRWDGMNAEVNGNLLEWQSSQTDGAAPGTYSFEVSATIDGSPTNIATNLSANVNSVTVGANGALTLNLAGIGAVALADVKQFNE